MTKAVVFGGSGFLGRHVAEALGQAGYQIVVADVTPPPDDLPATYALVDVCDPHAVGRVVEGARYVLNFAGIADIEQAADRPVDVAKVNVLGNVYVLDACAHGGVEKVLYASSVYVNSDRGLFYRTSKLASEKFVADYSHKYGLKYTIVRYGSIYGPRSGQANVIARYIRQALTEGRMVREGDGEELREYIHVRDAAVGTVRALGTQYDNSHVVISGLQAMRVKDILEMIREMLHARVEIVYSGPSALTHYRITPYTYNPPVAKKLILDSYYDLGQGLLDVMAHIHEELQDEAQGSKSESSGA